VRESEGGVTYMGEGGVTHIGDGGVTHMGEGCPLQYAVRHFSMVRDAVFFIR